MLLLIFIYNKSSALNIICMWLNLCQFISVKEAHSNRKSIVTCFIYSWRPFFDLVYEINKWSWLNSIARISYRYPWPLILGINGLTGALTGSQEVNPRHAHVIITLHARIQCNVFACTTASTFPFLLITCFSFAWTSSFAGYPKPPTTVAKWNNSR